MATVKIEGNTLTLEDAICKSDKSLIAALLPFYPAAANAEIKRKTEGETTTITVTKKAGTKGLAAVIEALEKAPETITPILLLEASGWRNASKADVDEALVELFETEGRIAQLEQSLGDTAAESVDTVPPGF